MANQLPFLALDAVDPKASQASATISGLGLTSVSFHAILTTATTPSVTVAFYASNEETPTNWAPVTSGTTTFSDNGQALVSVAVAYRWIRVQSSNGGGTGGGVLTVNVFGTGPN